MKFVLGIDPGLKGGLVFMNENGIISSHKMPVVKDGGKSCIDCEELAFLIDSKMVRSDYQSRIVIEKVHAMPKQGVTSVFTFGEGFGVLKGMAAAFDIPLLLVRPQEWQKAILGGIDKSLGKARSTVYCKQLYPDLKDLHKHDGLADAACIAEWGMRR